MDRTKWTIATIIVISFPWEYLWSNHPYRPIRRYLSWAVHCLYHDVWYHLIDNVSQCSRCNRTWNWETE